MHRSVSDAESVYWPVQTVHGPEAQKNILDAFGIESETEANWDVFPMTLVEGEIIRKDEVEC